MSNTHLILSLQSAFIYPLSISKENTIHTKKRCSSKYYPDTLATRNIEYVILYGVSVVCPHAICLAFLVNKRTSLHQLSCGTLSLENKLITWGYFAI